MLYDKKMTLMYESFYKNAFSYTSFITYMFMFSLEIFYYVFEKYNVKSMCTFIKFGQFIKNNVPILIKIMRKKTMWIDIETLKEIDGFEELAKVTEKLKGKKSNKIWILKNVKKYYKGKK